MTRNTLSLLSTCPGERRFTQSSGTFGISRGAVGLRRVLSCGIGFAGILLASTPLYADTRYPRSGSAFDYADVFTVPIPPPEKDQLLKASDEKQADALTWFIAGQLLEQQGELDSAMETYRKSLDLDPANYLLAEKVAFELMRREQSAEAIGVLKDCAVASPKDARPRVTLAFLYSRYLEKPDLSRKYADEALAINPEDIALYQRLYEIHLAQGRTAEANAVLDRALKSKSTNASFWIELGALLTDLRISTGETEPNAAAVKSITAIFEKAEKLAPKDPAVFENAGDFFARIGDLQKAIAALQKAVDLNANLLSARQKLAQAYLRADDPENTITQLQEIIRLNPLQQGAYELLGQLFQAKGDQKQAAAAFEQSLLLNPNHKESYTQLAQIYLGPDFDDPNRAVTLMEQAAIQFGDDVQIQFLLAIAYSSAKKYQEALTVFERTDVLFSEQSGLEKNPFFYFQYGAAAERAKLYDKAAEQFLKAIDMDPNFHQAMNYLGYMWIDRSENLEKGGDLVKRALAIEPNDGAYLDSMGWYHYRKGDFDQALDYLLRAHETLGENDPEICNHIGDAYQQLGDTGKAVEFWELAIDHADAPDRIDVESVNDKLEAARQRLTQLQEQKAKETPATEKPGLKAE